MTYLHESLYNEEDKVTELIFCDRGGKWALILEMDDELDDVSFNSMTVAITSLRELIGKSDDDVTAITLGVYDD